MRRFSRLLRSGAVLLLVAAVVDQIRRPADERTWTGSILVFPYDLRVPTIERFRERWWNPDDQRIFTPKVFGVGWEINLYQILNRFNLRG